MSFQITVKSCQPISSKLKPSNLYCRVRIGDNEFKTGAFKGKGDIATWNHTFASAAKQSFMKLELWEDGFFQDTFYGDVIVNISKHYSMPGMQSSESASVTKENKQTAQINFDIKYLREGQVIAEPISVEGTSYKSRQPTRPQQQLEPAKPKEQPREPAKSANQSPAKPSQQGGFGISKYDVPVPFSHSSNDEAEKKRNYANLSLPHGVGQPLHPEPRLANVYQSPSQEVIKENAKGSNSNLPQNPYIPKESTPHHQEVHQQRVGVPPSNHPLKAKPDGSQQQQNPYQQRQQPPQQHHVPQYYQQPQHQQFRPPQQGYAMQQHVVQPMVHPMMPVQPMMPMGMGMPMMPMAGVPIDPMNLGMLLTGEVMMGPSPGLYPYGGWGYDDFGAPGWGGPVWY